MRRHGSIWRHYRNERDFGEQSRRMAAWRTLRFRLKLVLYDVRHWWHRCWLHSFFAPLNWDIYSPPQHGSRLILDNLGIYMSWDDIEEAAKEKAAKERGDTICKVHSFRG